jgi:16S rRNA (cytosine967-C5)-methyltransferase
LLKEAWTLAIETLSWMQMQRLSERLALARTVRQLGIADADAVRKAHFLVCETVRRQNFIDRFINQTLKPDKLGEHTLGVQAFLRLYVYQTRIAKDRPEADLKEAERIAQTARSILGWKTLQKVEPFLGLLLTQKPETVLKGGSDEDRIGLTTFHPSWFVKYCFKLFGRSQAIAILEADTQKPTTYIRLNTLKVDENQILQQLEEEGIAVDKVDKLRYAYEVTQTKVPLAKTASFKERLFYVQDKASSFAAEAANPKKDSTVLDVCAAPGAKTTYLAQLMQNRGSIYSVDYSKRRMNVWKSEVAHMGVEIAEPLIADARNQLPLETEADIVVLDPPCTSTGTFRKLPSAKWRLTPQSIERMADIQWQMLKNCAEKVNPNGMLIYSTCSITVEENEMQIERFLKHHTEFSLAETSPKAGLPALRGLDKCQRLYPHIHQCNGFFIAKLQKASQ